MNTKIKSYEKLSTGQEVKKIILRGNNIEVEVINYGCIITSIKVPDKTGRTVDIVLGQNTLEDYRKANAFFGAVVGPVAGRISNGCYTIGSQQYHLEKNEGGITHLHSASAGLDKAVWNIEKVNSSDTSAYAEFSYKCNCSDKGYPGNVNYKVKYTLNAEDELILDYFAESDTATPINLTNHTYFNLNGEESGVNVLNHKLSMNSDFYLPLKSNSIPTGETLSVTNTPFDFRKPVLLGKNILSSHSQLRQFDGFDHPILLKSQQGGNPQATAYNPSNGIKLEVFTDQTSLVFYTCNGMDGSITGKNNTPYSKYYAFCFETQGMPNALNNNHFPSILLCPEKNYSQKTVWKFSTE